MRFGVVVFPGSNCDDDCYYVVRDVVGEEVDFIWHKERRVENNLTPFTSLCQIGQVLKIPIAHIDGRYYADDEIMRGLKENNQIIFRYCSEDGELSQESNPNGSKDFIAGISNRSGNVLGLMPHPERASESILSSEDGRVVFESVVSTVKRSPRRSLRNDCPPSEEIC